MPKFNPSNPLPYLEAKLRFARELERSGAAPFHGYPTRLEGESELTWATKCLHALLDWSENVLLERSSARRGEA